MQAMGCALCLGQWLWGGRGVVEKELGLCWCVAVAAAAPDVSGTDASWCHTGGCRVFAGEDMGIATLGQQ